MKQLWSPWRMKYIENQHAEHSCFLCAAIRGGDDKDSLVVHRGDAAIVLLNRYPYINGHLLIAPHAHSPIIENLPQDTLTELMELTSRATAVLREVYRAEAFNIGMNIGEAAGAGLAEHVHIHILPRWAGDTNFMTTTGGTRVLPETLDTTWEKISSGWKSSS